MFLPSTDTVHVTLPKHRLHLLYHELRPAAAAYSYVTSTALFEQHLQLYASLLTSESPIVPAVTFDDGHISNFTLAAPLLASRGLKAHFFITAGWISNRSGFMDWSQLRALRDAGHAIGAHGWSHLLLTHCTKSQLKSELTRSRLTLEDKLGVPITTMSLPGGRANSRVLAACRDAGYAYVYTSVPRPEPIPPGLTMGRLNIRGDMEAFWVAQLFAPGSSLLTRLNRTHRIKTAAQSLLGDRFYERLWSVVNRQEAESEILPESAFPQDPSA